MTSLSDLLSSADLDPPRLRQISPLTAMHSIAIVVSRLGRLITVVTPRSYLKERIVFKDCHSVGKTLLILLCAIELLGQEFGQTCGGDQNKVFIFSQTHAMFLVLGHDGRAIIDSISLMVLIRHYDVL